MRRWQYDDIIAESNEEDGMKTEFTWDEKTRIGVVLQGPSGDVLIHDDLLKTNTLVNHLELVYNRLPDNLVQHTVERFYSKRWYIV